MEQGLSLWGTLRFAQSDRESVCTTGHFQNMIAEIGFYRSLGDAHFRTENNFVKFRDHHARTELAEISALLP